MIFTVDDTICWLQKTSEKMIEQVDYLTVLDDVIGDGDHGLNMVGGFQAVVQELDKEASKELQSVANIMKLSAQQLMINIGGVSGILYATAFLNMGTVFQDTTKINHDIFTKGLGKAVTGIKHRGKVSGGEKTLLDVWLALFELFDQSNQFPSSYLIEKTAYQAMENTKAYTATKGKAALYEETSLGHIDPGAASTYYLFAALAETCKENEYE